MDQEDTSDRRAARAGDREAGRAGGPGADQAEMMARLQQELESLKVADHLLYMMESLSALAVGRMGLTPDTAERCDLEQARLAIDAFKALLDVVARARPPQEMVVHRSMLSQLQVAYVGTLGGAPEPEPPAAEPRDTLVPPDGSGAADAPEPGPAGPPKKRKGK